MAKLMSHFFCRPKLQVAIWISNLTVQISHLDEENSQAYESRRRRAT